MFACILLNALLTLEEHAWNGMLRLCVGHPGNSPSPHQVNEWKGNQRLSAHSEGVRKAYHFVLPGGTMDSHCPSLGAPLPHLLLNHLFLRVQVTLKWFGLGGGENFLIARCISPLGVVCSCIPEVDGARHICFINLNDM